MAEIGVLELTIHDNASSAGKGLDRLADALRAVKTAQTNFNLSPIGQQVTALTTLINGTKGASTAIKNLSGLFNAVEKFSKIQNFTIDVEPFKKLKEAIGDGLKVGTAGTQLNALRTAMTGDWGDGSAATRITELHDALQQMGAGEDVRALKTMSDSLSRFSTELERANKMAESMASPGDWRMGYSGGTSVGVNVAQGMAQGMTGSHDEIVKSAVQMAEALLNAVKDRLRTHSPSEETADVGRNVGRGLVQGLEETRSEVQMAARDMAETVAVAFAPLSSKEILARDGVFSADFYQARISEIKAEIVDLTAKAQELSGSTKRTDVKALDNVNKMLEYQSELLDQINERYQGVLSARNEVWKAPDTTATFGEKLQQMDMSGLSGVQTFFDSIDGKMKYVVAETKEAFDRLDEANRRAADLTASTGNAKSEMISLANIPATGLNGTFANASEELSHLTEELERAKASMEFFSKVYDRAQKNIKYQGEKEAFTRTLRMGEEGFYRSVESAEQYEAALKAAKEHISDYIANMARAKQESEAQAVSTQAVADATNNVADAIKNVNSVSGGGVSVTAPVFDPAASVAGSVQSNDTAGMVDSLVNNFSEIELLTIKMEGMKQALVDDINMNRVDTQQIAERTIAIQKLSDRITELTRAQEEAAGSTRDLGNEGKTLKSKFESMFPTLSNLIKRFNNMLKMRALRYVIRQIAAGIREGVENVYFYSQAVGTDFAPAMDSAATALKQFKNSIGAAAAPLIQALVPALQTVISWAIQGINYLNQFFALLRGQSTWTRALEDPTEAFEDKTKKIKNTQKAIKDLLADWDELNIIQSQNSGSGSSSGKTQTDYTSMFEEVSEYNEGIKKLVENIKKQFGGIWNLVKKVGAVILGWKVSNAFGDIVGTLGGILGEVLLVDLVFNISTLLSNQYIDTKEKGWLIADFLTTMVGAMFAKKIGATILGGGVAKIAVPIVFAVSAAATIMANVSHTDVSAVSEESIGASVTAALEGGVAAGLLAHLIGGGLGTSLLGGVVGTIGTFGVAIGLKADSRVVENGITEDSVVAKIESIAALGIAGAITGAKVGGTAAAAGGMAMLFGGAPIATYGVAIGLNAINEVVDGREITADVVKKNFIAGGLVGTGLAISTFAVAGATMAGIVGVGAGVLVVAALFGIEAYIAAQPKAIEWGDYKATKEEIQTFVNESLFNDPPSVPISLAKASIEPLGDAKANLDKAIEEAIGTAYSVRLGLVDKPLDEVIKQVDELITTFNATGSEYQKSLELAVSLVPIKDSDGKDKSKEILKNSSSRWGELDKIMTDIGNELADAYKASYDARLKGNLNETAEATIREITDTMSYVAQAIATGSARAQASHAIEKQIMNLSQETLHGILTEYQSQAEELVQELTKAREDAAEGLLAQQFAFEELAKYRLEQVGGDTNDELYKHYVELAKQAGDDYAMAMANLQSDVESANNKLINDKSWEKVRNLMLSVVKIKPSAGDLAAGKAALLDQYQYMIDAATGDINTDLMTKMLEEAMRGLYGDSTETILLGIQTGFLKYDDIFSNKLLNQLYESLMDLPGSRTSGFGTKFEEFVREKLGIKNFTLFGEEEQKRLKTENGIESLTPSDAVIEELAEAVSPEAVLPEATEVQKELVDYIRSAYNLDALSGSDLKYQMEGIRSQLIGQGYDLEDINYALDLVTGTKNAITETPPLDNTELDKSVEDAKSKVSGMVQSIRNDVMSLDGLAYTLNTPDGESTWGTFKVTVPVQRMATGGAVRSGDLVMANENGQFEMMGRMGNQPVVANNQQIVNGISQGVAMANGDVVSELRTLATMMQKLLSKELVARVVPSSGMGQSNRRSEEALDRVTG